MVLITTKFAKMFTAEALLAPDGRMRAGVFKPVWFQLTTYQRSADDGSYIGMVMETSTLPDYLAAVLDASEKSGAEFMSVERHSEGVVLGFDPSDEVRRLCETPAVGSTPIRLECNRGISRNAWAMLEEALADCLAGAIQEIPIIRGADLDPPIHGQGYEPHPLSEVPPGGLDRTIGGPWRYSDSPAQQKLVAKITKQLEEKKFPPGKIRQYLKALRLMA